MLIMLNMVIMLTHGVHLAVCPTSDVLTAIGFRYTVAKVFTI